jgi:heme exporter protein B
LWRDAALMAAKDLRIEWRSRVGISQVVPFGLIVLVLFAFALNADTPVLREAAGGLFWVAVLFASVLIVQRSFSLESPDGLRDGLRLSGLDPAGIFLGKAAAVAAQLVLVEAVLAGGVAVLYSTALRGGLVLLLVCALATVGLACAGTVYAGVAANVGVRETLLPLLLLPVVAPVLLSAARAWQETLSSSGGAWGWMRILSVFAVVYVAAGMLAFGPLLEDQ